MSRLIRQSQVGPAYPPCCTSGQLAPMGTLSIGDLSRWVNFCDISLMCLLIWAAAVWACPIFFRTANSDADGAPDCDFACCAAAICCGLMPCMEAAFCIA